MSSAERMVSEIVDARLDGTEGGREALEAFLRMHPEGAVEIQEAMQAARVLRSYRNYFAPPASFAADSKRLFSLRLAKISREAANTNAPAGSLRPMPRLRMSWVGAMILVALLLVSLTGISYAAGVSVPGDLVYPVKTVVENATLALVDDPAQKGALYMALAERRLAEMEILAGRGQFDLVERTLPIYQMEVDACAASLAGSGGGKLEGGGADASQFAEKLEEHLRRLEALKSRLPEPAQSGLAQAMLASSHGLSIAQEVAKRTQAAETAAPSATTRMTATQKPKTNAAATNAQNGARPTARPSATAKPSKTAKPAAEERKDHPAAPTPREQPTKKKSD